jgi:hypothetical protein
MKFPDGYAAGLRRFLNMMTGKLTWLKTHDYHIIMERFLPIMSRGYLDDALWMVLTELSYFYRQLCAKEITVERWRSWRRRYRCFYVKWRKIFLLCFSIQCNISLYIFNIKLKWVVLFNIGQCITLKEPPDILNEWLVIEQGLKGALPKHLHLRS